MVKKRRGSGGGQGRRRKTKKTHPEQMLNWVGYVRQWVQVKAVGERTDTWQMSLYLEESTPSVSLSLCPPGDPAMTLYSQH